MVAVAEQEFELVGTSQSVSREFDVYFEIGANKFWGHLSNGAVKDLPCPLAARPLA